jgi:small subunit ribosomal protein S18
MNEVKEIKKEKNNEIKTDNVRAIRHFDYKDTALLKRFLNPHGRISGRKHTHLSAVMQRKLAKAVKNARFMGFLPFVMK